MTVDNDGMKNKTKSIIQKKTALVQLERLALLRAITNYMP